MLTLAPASAEVLGAVVVAGVVGLLGSGVVVVGGLAGGLTGVVWATEVMLVKVISNKKNKTRSLLTSLCEDKIKLKIIEVFELNWVLVSIVIQ